MLKLNYIYSYDIVHSLLLGNHSICCGLCKWIIKILLVSWDVISLVINLLHHSFRRFMSLFYDLGDKHWNPRILNSRILNIDDSTGQDWYAATHFEIFFQCALRVSINITFDVDFQRTLKKNKPLVILLVLCFRSIDGIFKCCKIPENW